jgi:hypothetical protein
MAIRIEIGESVSEVLSRLCACRDLDSVLELGTPAELIKKLFGDAASKDLLDPFGDALVRGLSRPIPILSSIELASAAAPFFDPKRLAFLLELDDEGFSLMAEHAGSMFADDLGIVLSKYSDATRRLNIVRGLWNEALVWNRQHSQVGVFLDDVTRRALPKSRAITFGSIDAMTRIEQRRMLIEWLLQQFVAAETELIRVIALGHPFLNDSDSRSPQSSTQVGEKKLKDCVVACMAAADRLTHALDDRPKSWGYGIATSRHSWVLAPDRWRRQRQRLKRLYEVAAHSRADGEFDAAVASSWQEPATLYVGVDHNLDLSFAPGHVARRPPPRTTIPASVADAARFLRLGAVAPKKPKDWGDFVSRLMEPYYVHATLEIQSPNWVSKVDGATLAVASTGPLVVRAPKDMRELAQWGSYMGNCVHSLFGDDVHDGSRVILGLFRDETLTYNVGVHSSNGSVWEVNSRFNNGEVEPDVEQAIRAMVATAARPVLRQSPRLPVANRSLPPKATRRRTSHRWTARRVREIGDALRALPLGGTAWHSALATIDSDSTAGTWADRVTRLSRLDPDKLRTQLQTSMRAGHDVWPILVEHPIDVLYTFDHPLNRSLDDRERATLNLLRSGSDRLKLAANDRLLDDPHVAAAWELSRIRTVLRNEFAAFTVAEPRAVARSLRSDRTGHAKWFAALMWVRAQETKEPVFSGLRTVGFDLPNEEVRQVCRELLHSLYGGTIPMDIDPIPDWVADRLAAGLTLPRCPQIWLTRDHLAPPGSYGHDARREVSIWVRRPTFALNIAYDGRNPRNAKEVTSLVLD